VPAIAAAIIVHITINFVALFILAALLPPHPSRPSVPYFLPVSSSFVFPSFHIPGLFSELVSGPRLPSMVWR